MHPFQWSLMFTVGGRFVTSLWMNPFLHSLPRFIPSARTVLLSPSGSDQDLKFWLLETTFKEKENVSLWQVSLPVPLKCHTCTPGALNAGQSACFVTSHGPTVVAISAIPGWAWADSRFCEGPNGEYFRLCGPRDLYRSSAARLRSWEAATDSTYEGA